jgi:serine phosphatase RsbU (regulator of sigma subunit)/anti-sigma regulatory factor (Ser/Thr protein kinase)
MATSETAPSVAEEHLRRVQTVTDAALAHLTVESLLDELLIRIREILNADTAAVLLLDESRHELVATAAKGIEEEVEQGVRLPVGAGFAGRIAATGAPVVLDRVDHGKVLNPLLLQKGIRSLAGVPLIVDGKITGVLHVGTLHERRFDEEDIDLLRLAADRVALAIYARRQHEHRVIAQTLQRSLLPDRLPRVDGIEVGGLYRPAEGGMVGGDWYDVFDLPSSSLCVVVGDVAGRGLPAAITMARLRNAVRALAFVDEDPGPLVSRANDFLLHFDPGAMATMLVGILAVTGRFRYASAGHLPPLVVDAAGVARIVDEPAEPPLGGIPYTRYRERSVQMQQGSILVLYTDGLVERRGRPIDEGLEALRAAAEQPWATLDMLSSGLIGKGKQPALTDDVAILSLRFTRAQADDGLRIRVDADPRELAQIRRSFRSWLARCGVGERQIQDVLVAVGEALANAIEHAHGPGRGAVQIDAAAREGLLDITVRDQGTWREPRGTNRGLGRSLMAALMDEVDVQTGASGTVVTLRARVRDPS